MRLEELFAINFKAKNLIPFYVFPRFVCFDVMTSDKLKIGSDQIREIRQRHEWGAEGWRRLVGWK